MLHTSRARTCLFTELEVNRVQAEPSVQYSLTRLWFTIWSQLQTFENREASDERRQTETGEERKQRKALKHGMARSSSWQLQGQIQRVRDKVIGFLNYQWDQ